MNRYVRRMRRRSILTHWVTVACCILAILGVAAVVAWLLHLAVWNCFVGTVILMLVSEWVSDA